jgi:drug/metabolite transporter (DMT)-like permease
VNHGVLLALVTYATFSWGDGIIKSLAGGPSIFEIGFFTSLSAACVLYFTKPKTEQWRWFWRMKHPYAVHIRAACGLVAGLMGIFAFTTIPLAEAYAIAFLSPFLATLASMLVLGEKVGPWRWFAVLFGFAGMVLVVQPGFRALELGHLAAAGIAMVGAVTIIILRTIAADEKRTSLLAVPLIYAMVFNFVAMLPGFSWPSPSEFLTMLAAGAIGSIGQVTLIAALKAAPANQVAPVQYTQIGWAVLIGIVFYHDWPNGLALIGLAIIVASGLLTLVRERIRDVPIVPPKP